MQGMCFLCFFSGFVPCIFFDLRDLVVPEESKVERRMFLDVSGLFVLEGFFRFAVGRCCSCFFFQCNPPKKMSLEQEIPTGCFF